MTDILERANQAKAELQRTAEAANANSDLTAAARARLVEEAFQNTSDTLRELRAAAEQELAAEVGEAEKEAFGPRFSFGNEVEQRMAYRDAVERASRLKTQQDAMRAFKEAGWAGDKNWQRAIAAHAARQGWRQVIADYRASATDRADALRRYTLAMERASSSTDRLARGIALGTPNRPVVRGRP